MARRITLADGRSIEVECLSCALTSGLIEPTVYYFYNEDTTHHFQLWMVPRYGWMYEIGRSVES
jgi:hypothetical protein